MRGPSTKANIPNGTASGRGRIGVGNQWDPTKPGGPAQQAPLKPEYQAIYEANLADQAAGGQGTDPLFRCIPPGMPRADDRGVPDGDHHHAGAPPTC